jgi:hypothetical protein
MSWSATPELAQIGFREALAGETRSCFRSWEPRASSSCLGNAARMAFPAGQGAPPIMANMGMNQSLPGASIVGISISVYGVSAHSKVGIRICARSLFLKILWRRGCCKAWIQLPDRRRYRRLSGHQQEWESVPLSPRAFAAAPGTDDGSTSTAPWSRRGTRRSQWWCGGSLPPGLVSA